MNIPMIRAALADDAHALTRVHVEGGLNRDVTAAWRETHCSYLRSLLQHADPRLLAFVAVDPGGAGIVSAAVGFIHQALPRPDSPTGLTAHLASVATLAAYRRRGYATAVTTAFLNEAAARGCPAVTLNATNDGRPLYRSLGFVDQPRAMHLQMPPLRASVLSHRARHPAPPGRSGPVSSHGTAAGVGVTVAMTAGCSC